MRVTITGIPYKVHLKDEIIDRDGTRLDGLYDNGTGSIYVARQATIEAMEETLLHEILHGVADACHESLTEEQVYRLSRALYGAGVKSSIKFTSKDLKRVK
jgi:hypothetical protein